VTGGGEQAKDWPHQGGKRIGEANKGGRAADWGCLGEFWEGGEG